MFEGLLREELEGRRERLDQAIRARGANRQVQALLEEVDSALARIAAGTFGLCETCGDPIETDRLMADPTIRFCLDHLTPAQQDVLERDLALASKIQQGLLPRTAVDLGVWDFSYRYVPAHVVSGDYCDVVSDSGSTLYFLLGDVAGKGVAASMLMTQLHGVFRSLIPVGLDLNELVARASSIFCESSLPSHYATLVCAKAALSGQVEVCNAGHLPPLLVRASGEVQRLETSGLPVGMFCAGQYSTKTLALGPGDALALYTDGLAETENADGEEYGIDRIAEVCSGLASHPPAVIIDACFHAIDHFRRAARPVDDMTMMVVRRR